MTERQPPEWAFEIAREILKQGQDKPELNLDHLDADTALNVYWALEYLHSKDDPETPEISGVCGC